MVTECSVRVLLNEYCIFSKGLYVLNTWRYMHVQLNAAVRNWNKMPYIIGCGLLLYVQGGNEWGDSHHHVYFWLSFCFMQLSFCLNVVLQWLALLFLSFFFSSSLALRHWLGKYLEPNSSHPWATVLPVSRTMRWYFFVCAFSYEMEATRALYFVLFYFLWAEVGENSCFRQCKCEFSLIQTRNARKRLYEILVGKIILET